MHKITLLCIGKVKEPYYSQAINEYVKRLKPYANFKIIELESEPFNKSNKVAVKEKESIKLKKALDQFRDACVLILHEKGKQSGSLEFSRRLDFANEELVFVIGGSLGMSEQILNDYENMSLSKMTLPHELARLVLIEQIYRAVTIIRGKTYHY